MACGFLRSSRKKQEEKKTTIGSVPLRCIPCVDNVKHASLSLLFFGNEKAKNASERYKHIYELL